MLDGDSSHHAVRRVHIGVSGTVQGVGFRPFVYRLAHSLTLTGFVRNDSAGVAIEVEGGAVDVEHFLLALVAQAPPHAAVSRVVVDDITPRLDSQPFVVAHSAFRAGPPASIPADLATCDDCLRELLDPNDRRHRYPFINCTNCGPRFTIARSIPYDRASTTMAAFRMCGACLREYEDPRSRRFHAQPNACPRCGPRATLRAHDGKPTVHDRIDALAAAACAIANDAIVAVKGLGGYHLACRADSWDAVARLRRRKQRDDKPFAVMVRDVDTARRLAHIGLGEAQLLSSSARPIVLVRPRSASPLSLAPQVAPLRRELGLFLPYTPLHHLLIADVDAPLVMTSGNRTDEPIAFRDDEAFVRLAGIADLFLTHDRAIETRCDDSVMRVVRVNGVEQPLFLRRSRGYVPDRLTLPTHVDSPILAVGGQLKNTVCLARGDHAVVGPHAGDLDDAAAYGAWTLGIEHLTRLADTAPHVVSHDAHPDYRSSRYALDRGDLAACSVQHHHAHLAACLAEYSRTSPAIGLIFDGAGYGTDGTIWGGEILLGDLGSFERLGHLRAVRMPGGDAATRDPWRMAAAWIAEASDARLPPLLRDLVTEGEWSSTVKLAHSASTPLTTSAGRLLDACAAICGIRARTTYEGQAAIEFETLADARDTGAYPIDVHADTAGIILDPRPLIRCVAGDAQPSRDVPAIAARVHRGLVYAATSAAQIAADRTNVRTVVLSGGVFQNVFLLEALSSALGHHGFDVLVPRRLPPNDGGLSYGQAAIAAWRRSNDVSGRAGSDR